MSPTYFLMFIIDCFLRGKDVFQSKLIPGSDLNYIDIPIIPKEDNKLTCDIDLIVLSKKHAHFELFNFDRDKDNCDPIGHFCIWQILDEGTCMRSETSCKLFFPWNK
ncbi:hypothetical protein H5410_033744 [Solanum commersonii]|uniref:Uncharacterized protein n=1 Tax=Solanum commersonii TaxID=4109 RepID=A0A9J5YTZ7_SOLCO|nr:hypothetical protein H5410_033744 [Solanum commersonii]